MRGPAGTAKPIGLFPGKYEWAGQVEQGDCSLRVLSVDPQYDAGAWVCQVSLLRTFRYLKRICLTMSACAPHMATY